MNQKQAQKVVNSLSDFMGVPHIKVITKKYLGDTDAQFNAMSYEIEIEEGASEEDLIHEFGHYLTRLIEMSHSAEEHLATFFALGLVAQQKGVEKRAS